VTVALLIKTGNLTIENIYVFVQDVFVFHHAVHVSNIPNYREFYCVLFN